MKNKNKLVLPLAVCGFLFLAGASSNAQAEYYLVYPGSMMYGCEFSCGPTCFDPCYQTPVHYFHYESPRRHYHTGTGEMEEYRWISVP